MIKNYDREVSTSYSNIFQLAIMFLVTEYIEILVFLKIFDKETLEYDQRRHSWFLMVLSFLLIGFMGILVSAICLFSITMKVFL
jgi:hypothetical protein